MALHGTLWDRLGLSGANDNMEAFGSYAPVTEQLVVPQSMPMDQGLLTQSGAAIGSDEYQDAMRAQDAQRGIGMTAKEQYPQVKETIDAPDRKPMIDALTMKRVLSGEITLAEAALPGRQLMKTPKVRRVSEMRGTKGAMTDAEVAQTGEPSYWDRFKKGAGDYFGDEENMANLAMGLNSMRLNPDQQLSATMGKKAESARARKGAKSVVSDILIMAQQATDPKEKARLNAIARMASKGAIDAPTAIAQAMKRESGGINVNMGNDKYYDQIKADAANMQTEYRERGQNARTTLDNFGQLERALSNYGETGPTDKTKQKIREMAASVGMSGLIDEKKMSDGQYLKAVKNRMVAEQLRLNKGPQTDFDAEFAGTYIPGLGTSTEANTALMNFSKSISTQQLILSKLVQTARMTQPEKAMQIIAMADELAMDSPAAMKNEAGQWTTFIEFYNNPKYAKNTPIEKLTAWSGIYKKYMGME